MDTRLDLERAAIAAENDLADALHDLEHVTAQRDALLQWVTVDILRELRGLCDEIDRLRALLRDANEAFDECTGDYQKELVEGEPWRAAVSPKDGEQ